ncbi:MAG: hypothetical protein ACLGSD_18540 [Acidobacteriota bacterium]
MSGSISDQSRTSGVGPDKNAVSMATLGTFRGLDAIRPVGSSADAML